MGWIVDGCGGGCGGRGAGRRWSGRRWVVYITQRSYIGKSQGRSKAGPRQVLDVKDLTCLQVQDRSYNLEVLHVCRAGLTPAGSVLDVEEQVSDVKAGPTSYIRGS